MKLPSDQIPLVSTYRDNSYKMDKENLALLISCKHLFIINPYIFRDYDCNMKSYKILNSCRYGSVARPRVTKACVSLKLLMAICCTSLLILILMSLQRSAGQEDPSLLQTPNFSSSIFFTGKALEFAYEKPSVGIYTVSAVEDNSTNNVGPCKSINTTSMESQAPVTDYATTGTLLAAVIPLVSDEYLQQLPFSELDPSQVSQIIVKVPADKAGLILSKISADKREEILSKIPAEKRQEIVNNLIK